MSKVGTELNQKTIYWDVLFGNGLQFRLRSTVEARSCLEMQRIRSYILCISNRITIYCGRYCSWRVVPVLFGSQGLLFPNFVNLFRKFCHDICIFFLAYFFNLFKLCQPKRSSISFYFSLQLLSILINFCTFWHYICTFFLAYLLRLVFFLSLNKWKTFLQSLVHFFV